MRKYIYLIFLFILLIFFSHVEIEASPTVTYISAEGFYINGGTNYNLRKSDTLLVMRGDTLIALCMINNISQNSSACIVIEEKHEMKIGDSIVDISQNELLLMEANKSIIKKTQKPKKKFASSENRMSGYVTSQHYLISDMSNSSLSSYQPSLRAKLKVDNLFGKNLKLQIKHRSRYYKRSNSKYYSQIENNWTHRLYEFAVYTTDKPQAIQYSFGRQSVYQMRGIGFIDGLYIGKQLNNKTIVGTAIGLEPENVSQKISLTRKKAGLFVAYTPIKSTEKKIVLSAALAGSYFHNDVNREYLYLQTDFSNRKITFNQSIEIDYFRSQRKETFDKSIDLTSYYGRINYSLNTNYSFYLSYDSRKQVRYYDDTINPDSLFDDNHNNGIKFGIRLKPLQKLSISINAGKRSKSNSFTESKFGSIAISAFRFPQKQSSITVRFYYLETFFTTAYRPSLSYRFPLRKGMYLTLSGTSNIYSSSGKRSSTSYIDAQTYYTLSNNYFISMSIRQYFEKDLQSNQFFFEFGKHF